MNYDITNILLRRLTLKLVLVEKFM